MAITRRQFLTRTGLTTAGSFLGPEPVPQPVLREALPTTIGDRYLVVVYLDGGNDGLNTVIAVRQRRRHAARRLRSGAQRRRQRPATRAGGAARAAAGGRRARHARSQHRRAARAAPRPGRAEQPVRAGHASPCIQGCGYPDYNLSHDISTTDLGDRQIRSARWPAAPAGWDATWPRCTHGSEIPGRQHPRRGGAASCSRPAPACSPCAG